MIYNEVPAGLVVKIMFCNPLIIMLRRAGSKLALFSLFTSKNQPQKFLASQKVLLNYFDALLTDLLVVYFDINKLLYTNKQVHFNLKVGFHR